MCGFRKKFLNLSETVTVLLKAYTSWAQSVLVGEQMKLEEASSTMIFSQSVPFRTVNSETQPYAADAAGSQGI